MTDAAYPRPVGADFTTAIFARIGIDRYTVAGSELGPVFIGWTRRGVSAVRRAGPPQAEASFTDWYRERVGRRIVRAVEEDAVIAAARAKLADPRAAGVALDLAASSAFERAVFAGVERIETGHARTLELVACESSGADAADVAGVLAANPVPLLVPCHRVIREDHCCDASYVFGAPAQRRLLVAEGLDPAAIDRLTASGVRYIGSADGWFCLPSCGDIATRAEGLGYVKLRTLAEARERGLRACEDCRPVAA